MVFNVVPDFESSECQLCGLVQSLPKEVYGQEESRKVFSHLCLRVQGQFKLKEVNHR